MRWELPVRSSTRNMPWVLGMRLGAWQLVALLEGIAETDVKRDGAEGWPPCLRAVRRGLLEEMTLG